MLETKTGATLEAWRTDEHWKRLFNPCFECEELWNDVMKASDEFIEHCLCVTDTPVSHRDLARCFEKNELAMRLKEVLPDQREDSMQQLIGMILWNRLGVCEKAVWIVDYGRDFKRYRFARRL